MKGQGNDFPDQVNMKNAEVDAARAGLFRNYCPITAKEIRAFFLRKDSLYTHKYRLMDLGGNTDTSS